MSSSREKAGISHQEKMEKLLARKLEKEAKRKALSEKKTVKKGGKTGGQTVMEERIGASADRDKVNYFSILEVPSRRIDSVAEDTYDSDSVVDVTVTGDTVSVGALTEPIAVKDASENDSVDTNSVLDETVDRDSIVEVTALQETVLYDNVAGDSVLEDTVSCDSVSNETVSKDTVARDGVSRETVSNETVISDSVVIDTVTVDSFTSNAVYGVTVRHDTILDDSVPENSVPENSVPENSFFEDTVLEYSVKEDSVFEGSVSSDGGNLKVTDRGHVGHEPYIVDKSRKRRLLSPKATEVLGRALLADLSANEMKLFITIMIDLNDDWESGSSLSLAEIAKLIGSDTSNTARLVKSLLSKGIFRKQKNNHDRRNTYLLE